MKLTVLSRTYCHLCDDMVAALKIFQSRHLFEFDIDVVDVDLHIEIELKYGDKVPVLLSGEIVDDVEICHYFLDEAKLSAQLHKSLAALS